MTMYVPEVARVTVGLNDADAAMLRRVCAVEESEDSVIQEILTKQINGSRYSSGLKRPILQRVVTQYYVDKSPMLYLWGRQLVEHGGYPQVHVELHNSFTLVDSTNYDLNTTRRGRWGEQNFWLFVRFTNQQYYDSLDLQPDGVSPRVRVRYLTNTNGFGDLSDDFKMYLMLKTRFRYDEIHNRQPRLDLNRIQRMGSPFEDRSNTWYPIP